jgi:hypothetical protein
VEHIYSAKWLQVNRVMKVTANGQRPYLAQGILGVSLHDVPKVASTSYSVDLFS